MSMFLRRLAAAATVAVLPFHAAGAEPIRLYAAGSLTAAVRSLIAASGLPDGSFAAPVFGPAGVLRERLAKGEAADLFLSADTKQPASLAASDAKMLVVPFAGNRMCVLAKGTLGLTTETLLDRLTDPKVRVAASTPGADPGGDYAMAVFDRADRVRPGAGALLKGKVLHLLGGPTTMVPGPGHNPAASIILEDRADALIYYCSSAKAVLKAGEGLVSVPLPEDLEVHPVYSMAVMSANADAARFALFVVSTKGQQILSESGFLPLAGAR